MEVYINQLLFYSTTFTSFHIMPDSNDEYLFMAKDTVFIIIIIIYYE